MTKIASFKSDSLNIWRTLISSGVFTELIDQMFEYEEKIRTENIQNYTLYTIITASDLYFVLYWVNPSGQLLKIDIVKEKYLDTRTGKNLSSLFIHGKFMNKFLTVYRSESTAKNVRKV